MPSDRRSFLLGRRAPPAQQFRDALRRAVTGTVVAGTAGNATILIAADAGDIVTARALCVRHGVKMALRVADASATTAASGAQPGVAQTTAVLWVDVQRLDTLQPVSPQAQGVALWRVGPGCRLGDLARAGLTQFEALAPDTLLCTWLADPHDHIAPGQCVDTGLMGADMLFADGTIETLGPFGAAGTRPLRSTRVQSMVPALFQLAQGPDADLLARQPVWHAEGRLDALTPRHPDDLNLAQLFLGSRGRYAWMLQCLMRACPAPGTHPIASSAAAVPSACVAAAQRLNQGLQQVLDSTGVLQGSRAAPMTE